jgi:hypothetical protein
VAVVQDFLNSQKHQVSQDTSLYQVPHQVVVVLVVSVITLLVVQVLYTEQREQLTQVEGEVVTLDLVEQMELVVKELL